MAVGQEPDEDRFEELAVGHDRALDFAQDGVAVVTRSSDVHRRSFTPSRLVVSVDTTSLPPTVIPKSDNGVLPNEPR
ncbi:hypothetical protein GCM10009000_123020 [Halobacterium noricense]